MRYLLLGGSGFIGSHLARRLVSLGQVTIIGRQDTLELDIPNIEYKQMDFVKCKDFTDYIKNVDVVVHMISTIIPSEDTSRLNSEIENNVIPTIKLLEDASRLKKEVIFISSGGAVYGESNVLNKESSPTNPICNYGIIKLMIEKYLALYHQYYGLEYKIIRPSNPYSEAVYHNKKQGIIPVIIDNIKKNKPMVICGDKQIRDYIHIDDLIEGIISVFQYKGDERIFNIGTGVGYSINEIIKIIENKMGKKLKVLYRPMRECDVLKNVLDVSLVKKETGWESKIALEDGISRVVREGISNV